MRPLFQSAAVEDWPLGVESAWPSAAWAAQGSVTPGQRGACAEAAEAQAGGAVRPAAGLCAAAQPAANDARVEA